MDFKTKIAEIITQTHKTPQEQADEILQFIADNAESKQLIQSCVVESVCKHCANKLCDSQTFNQQCFNCGKKPL